MGAVGPNHIVELINSDYAVYDKTTGAFIGTRITDSAFRQNALDNGGGTVSDSFDPRVVYDPASARWFATAVDAAESVNSSILVGVSDASDPTAGWPGFRIDADPDNRRWADFPTLGVDADGVYVSANMFDLPAPPPRSTDVSVFSFPKADLLLATPTVANRTEFLIAGIASLGFAVQPSVDFGSSDGRAAMLARPNGTGTHSTLRRTDILNAATQTAGAASLSSSGGIAVTSYSAPPLANQPGPDDNVNTSDHRISGNVFEQADSLWTVQSVSIGGRSAVRWYEIDETTSAVLQSGTIDDNNLDLYFPSIAADSDGNVVIGISSSSDVQFISSYAVAGTTVGGVTTFDDITLLKAGVASYERLDNSGRNRWGDYIATVLDPVTPLHFWTFRNSFPPRTYGLFRSQRSSFPNPPLLRFWRCAVWRCVAGGLASCDRCVVRRQVDLRETAPIPWLTDFPYVTMEMP